jgi:hypothetical protein
MTEEEKTTENNQEEVAEEATAEAAPVQSENNALEEGDTPAEEDKQAEEDKSAEEDKKDEGDKKAEIEKKLEGKKLDKMTVKDLKEVAKEIPDITGVHGMNKPDLLVEIKRFIGIEEAPKKTKDVSIVEVKKKIKALKIKRAEAISSKDKKMATICKRKIARLKKKTRRAA